MGWLVSRRDAVRAAVVSAVAAAFGSRVRPQAAAAAPETPAGGKVRVYTAPGRFTEVDAPARVPGRFRFLDRLARTDVSAPGDSPRVVMGKYGMDRGKYELDRVPGRSDTDDVLDGLANREDTLALAMMLDELPPNFSEPARSGLSSWLSGWGMPGELKAVAGVPWSDHDHADPADDVRALMKVGLVRHNVRYDRLTMSTETFLDSVRCTRFHRAAETFEHFGIGIPEFDDSWPFGVIRRALVAVALAFEVAEVELEDRRFWSVDGHRGVESSRVFPKDTVLLSCRAHDKDASVMDLANGEFDGSAEAGKDVPGYPGVHGPVCYVVDNGRWPVLYAGSRVFPRKFNPAATAVLKVG